MKFIIDRKNKKKFINIIFTIFISFSFIAFLNIYNQNLYTVAYESLFIYIMFFTSWFIQCKRKINFYTIFLVFTYIFYFGQFLLIILGVEFKTNRTIVGGLLSYENIINTGKFVLVFMVILHLGLLLSTFNIDKFSCEYVEIRKENNRDIHINNNFKKVVVLMFLISIIPSYIILLNNIKITLSYGYGAIFTSESYTLGGFNNILKFVSLLTIPSFIGVFILYKDNKKLKIFSIIFIIYICMYFMSGSRLNGVLLISVILLIKYNWYKEFTKKDLLKIVILIVLGTIILSLISEIRNAIYNSADITYLIQSTIKGIVFNNPLFLILEEGGYTFLAISTVLTYTPISVPYNNGLSYINSLFMLIPNLFWDVHPAAVSNTDIVFKGFLTQYGGIGSSFISEAYYNFGKLSIVFAVLFGILIGILTRNIIKYSYQKNSMKFYLNIYVAQFSLFYVRSDTVSFWRNFVYYGLIPIILSSFLSIKKNQIKSIK